MSYADIKELLKDAKNLATGANDLQLKGKLLDIQDQVYELQEENRNLRLENEELKNAKILESDLEFHDGYYTRKSDGRNFCAKCWDDNKKLISTTEADLGEYCPVCKSFN